MEKKVCSRCKEPKDTILFYADSRHKDGLKSQCVACHNEGNVRTRDPERHKVARREGMRTARVRDPHKYRDREREASRRRPKSIKTAARQILNRAVRRGDIVKPSVCSRCGEPKFLTGHHPDYSKPLAVVWLCYECHGNE